MKKFHYLLSATGRDRPGIVGAVTGTLYKNGFNMEDSSMMRLGSEFGMIVIFTTNRAISVEQLVQNFEGVGKKYGLSIGIKKITDKEAKFSPPARSQHIVTVHGPDRPGIVFHVTDCLSKHRFNITDLSTHRTSKGKKSGYILLIEGEFLRGSETFFDQLEKALHGLQRKLNTVISLRKILPNQSF